MYGPWNGGWGFGMMFMSFLFLALIVVGVVFVVRSFSPGGHGPPDPTATARWTSWTSGSPAARSTSRSTRSDGEP